MTNFEFLSHNADYALFSGAAIEAEKVYTTHLLQCALSAAVRRWNWL